MWTIYHNPRCSKSRETLAILNDAGVEPRIVEYLAHPPSEKEIGQLLRQLALPPAEIVRTQEEKYRELKFDLESPAVVARELARHPELMERPIVVKGERAVLGRPPANVRSLLP